MNIQIKKLNDKAKLPTYATAGSAGFDFYATEYGQLSYGCPLIIGTGLAANIPENHVMMIFSRSGHGFKDNVRLSNCVGIIDSDYRGEIKVKLTMDFPSYMNSLVVNPGDRIAQGLVLPINQVTFSEVQELPVSNRGEGGFGSTGSK